MWYEKVGDGPDTYILVAQERLPEEEWTKLFEQHAEYQKRIPAGWALLIDLRSKEPIIKPVPKDHRP